MAILSTVNDHIARIGNQYFANPHFSVERDAATSATLLTGQVLAIQKFPILHTTPSLPSGVTAFKLLNATLYSSNAQSYLLCKLVDLGSLNIATPTFTDGSAMPSVLEGNNSNSTYSGLLCEVTTALNSAPGNLQPTYVDQDGNTAEAGTATAMGASSLVNSCAFFPLNTGDIGVRDITTATRTSGTTPTGIMQFWGVVPLGVFNVPIIQMCAQLNFVSVDLGPPILGANESLYVLGLASTTVKRVWGDFYFVGEQA